jgi:hypothetical protein
MNLKEAKLHIRGLLLDKTDAKAGEVVMAELRAAKREKRDMFKAMSPSCNGRYPISGDCKWVHGQHSCSMGVCPNLKKAKVKP